MFLRPRATDLPTLCTFLTESLIYCLLKLVACDQSLIPPFPFFVFLIPPSLYVAVLTDVTLEHLLRQA